MIILLPLPHYIRKQTQSHIQDCWKGDPEQRPTVEQVTPRLEAILKELDISEEDVLESLSTNPQAASLFEEKRRRIEELKTQLKETQNKAARYERLYREEAHMRQKLEAKYLKLKVKYKTRVKKEGQAKVPAAASQKQSEVIKIPKKLQPTRGPLSTLTFSTISSTLKFTKPSNSRSHLQMKPEVLASSSDEAPRRNKKEVAKEDLAPPVKGTAGGSSTRKPVRVHVPSSTAATTGPLPYGHPSSGNSGMR